MRGLGSVAKRHSELTLVDGDTFVSSDAVNFWGADDNGLHAKRPQMEALTTVYRAVNFLSETQGLLELNAYKRETKELIRAMILEDPCGGLMMAPEWREYELRCRLLRGNSFAYKVGMTQKSPQPRHIVPIDPDRVTVSGVYRGFQLVERVYVVTRPFAPVMDVNGKFVDLMDRVGTDTDLVFEDRMFHVPGQGFDGVSGMSPIDACRLSLAVEVATEEGAARFYGKGNMMSGFLKTSMKLDEPQAAALKKRWQQKMGGVQNSYEVAVMDSGLEFQPVTVSPEQAQFLQTRQFGVEQVSRIFGVPPFLLMLAAAGQSFGTGLEQQLTATDIFTLSGWLGKLEGRASHHLLPITQYAKFDKAPLERADMKSRWAGWSIARKNGILSVDEIRMEEGWPTLDTATSKDAEAPVPTGTPADEPGGNDGSQGGGPESDIGETDPAAEPEV